jgi:hypothetical protein
MPSASSVAREIRDRVIHPASQASQASPTFPGLSCLLVKAVNIDPDVTTNLMKECKEALRMLR